MGLIGIFFAGALMVGFRPPALAAIISFIVCEVFAWYVFLIFIFIQPGLDYTAVPDVPYPWTSRVTYNAFAMGGILSAAFYCGMIPAP